jgi:hypothetical protein
MTHAVLVQVTLDPDSDLAHRHSILHDIVIPQTKALPGFQRATFMNDGAGTGTCIVTFHTEENAIAAVTPLTPPGGPSVLHCGVYEVEVEVEA